MKHFFLFIFSILTLASVAQTKQKKKVKTLELKKATHVPASKKLVGIWRQTGVANPDNGEVYAINTGNFKVINPDGTYYTFVNWDMLNTTIGQYGTYTITSDSTMVEHIIRHALVPALDGKESTVRFKMTDENTMVTAWSTDNKKWDGDQMTRLSIPGQQPAANTTMLLDVDDGKATRVVCKPAIATPKR